MAKATFPETTGVESLKPADSGTRSASDLRNALSALFQGDVGALRPRAQDTPDMTIKINPAVLNSYNKNVYGTTQTPSAYAGGNSPSMSAPSSNPRIDIVYLNDAGSIAVVTGSEAGSPTPSYSSVPKTGIPIALVYHKTTATKIVNNEDASANPNESYIYADIRPLCNLGGGASADDMAIAQDNIALLAFRLAVQGSLTVQKMEDGIVDEYEDETGIDTGASTATYDSTNDCYTNPSGDQTGSGSALSSGDATTEPQSAGTSDNDTAEVFSNFTQTQNGAGQKFTASGSYSLTGVKFKLGQYNADQVVKFVLYATSSGLPTGSPLAETGNYNASEFEVTPSEETFLFTSPYTLTSGTVYAIMMERVSGSVGNGAKYVKWRAQTSSDTNMLKKDNSSAYNTYSSGWNSYFVALSENPKENAFDDDTDTYWGSSQTSGSISGAGYIGYDFGSGVTKAITGFTIKQHHADQAINSVKVQRSDNGSDWTDVETVSITADTSAQTKAFTNTTSARYWRLLANDETTSGSWEVEEVGFTLSEDLELISESFEAEATPSEARICIFLEEVDSITLNTDFKAYVSRDDGTNWAEVTLVNEGEYESGKDILSASVNVSSQPSDKTMRYKLITDNLKAVKVHGTSLSWKA